MKRTIRLNYFLLGMLLGSLETVSLRAAPFLTNTVEKVVDINVGSDGGGSVLGGYGPLGGFCQASNDLWFVTKSGGAKGLGTISKFSLLSHSVSQFAFLDNNAPWGATPQNGMLVVDQTNGYFTTTVGGLNPGQTVSSNKGALSKIDLISGSITVLHAFTNVDGATPRSAPIKVGDDLWGMTSLGGISNRGVVFRYNLTAATYSVMANLDGPNTGGYAYGNPVWYNNALYFTTFIGGSVTASGVPLGSGAFERLTLDSQGNATITRLLDMPLGYAQFPGATPLLVGTNSFYFLTQGTAPTAANGSPGALIRYDLDTGAWANVFSFSTNTGILDGMQPGYSGLTEWQGELYFVTHSGGTNNTGALGKYNIASNTVVKLADLDAQVGPLKLGNASFDYNNDGFIVMETNRYFMYFSVYSGGANGSSPGYGTLLRVYLPPQPLQAAIAPASTGNVTLSWSGGYPPFDILTNSDLSAPVASWSAVASGIDSTNNTTNWSVTLPAPAGATFYRVRGLSQ